LAHAQCQTPRLSPVALAHQHISIFCCRKTGASTAPCTSRWTCCPTHCASYCAPCQPLLRAFSGTSAMSHPEPVNSLKSGTHTPLPDCSHIIEGGHGVGQFPSPVQTDPGFRFRVPGFGFRVSSFRFQVSDFWYLFFRVTRTRPSAGRVGRRVWRRTLQSMDLSSLRVGRGGVCVRRQRHQGPTLMMKPNRPISDLEFTLTDRSFRGVCQGESEVQKWTIWCKREGWWKGGQKAIVEGPGFCDGSRKPPGRQATAGVNMALSS